MIKEKSYYIDTYGCQMNVHDSEKIAGILKEKGYKPADDISQADIIIFNTCCIRETAEKKIFGSIGNTKKYKKVNKELIIAVVGCMAQQEGIQEKIQKSYGFVDIVLGSLNFHNLSDAIDSVLTKENSSLK